MAPAGTEQAAQQAAERLSAACQPLYRYLFVPIGQQPDGTIRLLSPLVFNSTLRMRCVNFQRGYHEASDARGRGLAGIKFLVDLRADLRQLLAERPAAAAPLRALDHAIRCRSRHR